jgi:hypothetical protein
MEDKITEDTLANQEIDIYTAVRDIMLSGRPVTMYGISRLTSLPPSYIWVNFGLKGQLMKIIDDAHKECKVRQRSGRASVSSLEDQQQDN